MKTSKKIISLLMCMLMVLTMVPMSVFAEGTKIYISEIRATSDFVAPEYGAAYYVPAFNFTLEEDLPVSFSYGDNADWFRWVNDGWGDTIDSGEYFVEGTYCYDVRITLEDEDNYYWDENTKLYVDGVEWTDVYFGNWIKSPAFEISYVAGKPLIAGFHGHIYDSYSGLPIEQSNNTVTLVGGTMPYTFTKVSGPEWLTVSDTGVISGTPTVVGNNDELVIKVTDAVGEEATVNIRVNTTYLNPDDRQVISRVVGTVDIGTLRCGDSISAVRNFTAQVIEGAPAELKTGSSDLYDSSMNALEDSSLVAGEYYMDIEIAVDGEAGYTHMLDKDNLEVIINGQTAFDVNPSVGKTSSSDWVKFGGIVVEHWFDNDTDATCNGCDYTREGCDHQYDAICSETCNVCGATRAVEHEYNNACDHDCNLCGAVRIPSDHVWTDCYDKYCGVCNFYRDNGHVYDDCADDVCNICEYVRTPGHTYSSATNETCDVCGATRTLNYIQMGETKTVNIVNGGEYAEFLFTPTATMVYSFYAMGEYDTYGYIFDEAYNQLTYNDDGAGDRNFAAVLELTAGTTYALRARMYNSSQTGTFTVKVGCETHTYTDDCDEICDICDAERNDVPHVWSNACDAECNVCGETRVPEAHVYTNIFDTDCDVCSVTREIRTITPGVAEDVEIATPGQVVDFIFIPTVSGIYYFLSESEEYRDTMGYVLNADGNVLDDDDQSGGNGQFKIEYEMTAGTTYALRAKLYYSDETGSFTVRLVCKNHTYGTDCTVACDICGTERDNTPHAWSNACDAECNACGETRVPEDHVYTNLLDTDCDICGADRTINTITINEVKNVDITEAGGYVDFVFIPEASGVYSFISIDEIPLDTHGYIYDAEETLLEHDDDSAGYTHFKVVYEMTAGTPYVLRAKMHNSTSTGSFSVKVTCNEHVYTDVCDGSCNLCGEMRENYHVYDNDCDAQCNECSATRTPAEHIYDNDCDKNCNECDAERTVPDHVYDNACDKNCNVCNYGRSVPDHVYDDDCDEECNECAFARYAEHNYDNYLDTDCNDCSEVRTLKYIQYGDVKTADITVPGEKISYVFTPAVTGNYCFYSRENGEDVDCYGYILTVEGNTITSDDDGAGDGMFTMTYELEAGTTYILQAKLYSSSRTGIFEALLTCGEHYYNNACDTNCNVCGETREVPDHVYSGICDADCNECGVTREAPDHVYDNVCDTDCNECGSSRTVGDHVFSNACDTDCNVCGVTREVPDHVYDNVCDTDCNECDAERTVPDHDYVDGICTGCGKEYKIPVSEIQLTYDIDALKFETASTEWVVTENIRSNVNTTTTGVYKNNGNTLLANSNYSSCTYSDVYLDADKDYHICYNLRVRDGYDWIDSAKATGAAAYTGLTIFANGVNITNVAYCKYNPSENWLLIYVPIGKPSCSHNYDNVCDTDCNECGETREVPDHVYSGICDADCNVCGDTRETREHTYTDCEDTTCNGCGKARTAPGHDYYDCYDITCADCDYIRSDVPDHCFEDPCQPYCSDCGAVNPDATAHTYDGDCNDRCNVCDWCRIPPHSYGGDDTCDLCGKGRFIVLDRIDLTIADDSWMPKISDVYDYDAYLPTVTIQGNIPFEIGHGDDGWRVYDETTGQWFWMEEGDVFEAGKTYQFWWLCINCEEDDVTTLYRLSEDVKVYVNGQQWSIMNMNDDFWCGTESWHAYVYVTAPAITLCGHTYDNACDAECNNCHATRTPAAHTGGTATCTQKAKCSVCGEAYGSLKAHTYKTVTTKATLSKNGKIESKCSCGKVKSTQTIAKIGSVTLSATKYIHDGKNKTPTVTVKDANGKKLVKNTDYKLSVASSRKGIGKYTVKVTFIGKYSGTKNVYFTILPGKPASVKSASQTTSSIKLSWSAVSGAAGYTVYRYSPSKKAYVKAGTTTGTSLTVKGLLTGTKYTFKVVAYGKTSGGKVYNSEGYTLLKTATKTKTPELTKVTASSTKGKAYVYHSNVSGETGYTVYYSTSKTSGFKKYANFKADTTRCDITKLTSGKTYYFKVRTYIKTDSGYVYSPWSAVKGIKVK